MSLKRPRGLGAKDPSAPDSCIGAPSGQIPAVQTVFRADRVQLVYARAHACPALSLNPARMMLLLQGASDAVVRQESWSSCIMLAGSASERSRSIPARSDFSRLHSSGLFWIVLTLRRGTQAVEWEGQ
ncbi:hypothetical protein BP00DRAFT_248000 [Aspergillus indologenus CBS 114.80]|uniref:Uncharacterized protein n=1 Tax=Aspergillus indologenus CBS 114.80 TaxID=1450541 RepID=A0A2V5J4T8_9EURO|nr:hypothetical protein BP00DRAFT_248000 [Aspergillus indologenus CBS 114.80]